jgi:uncharacterized protein YheU (UPF0270 family)
MSALPDDEPGADDDAPAGVEVPIAALSESALSALIESFVLREGTDYGELERSHERKIADVRRQLERREARIEFDPQTESVNIVLVLARAFAREHDPAG